MKNGYNNNIIVAATFSFSLLFMLVSASLLINELTDNQLIKMII